MSDSDFDLSATLIAEPAWSTDLVLAKTLRAAGPGHLVFGRFRLERELERDKMEVAWLVKDEQDASAQEAPSAGQAEGELKLLKFLGGHLTRRPESLTALQREIREHLSVDHPGVVRLYDLHISPENGYAAVSMEWVDGPTLAELQAAQPDHCFDPEDLLPWLRQLCETLDELHAKHGLVHRELIPQNVILAGRGRLKLADAGLAAAIDVLWDGGFSRGAPGYLCPQQINGQLAQMSDDIYAVGALFYELLSGKPPFYIGAPEALRFQAAHDIVPSIAARREELRNVGHPPIDKEWEASIAACLAKEPAGRPATAGEVVKRIAEPQAEAPAVPAAANAHASRSTITQRPEPEKEAPPVAAPAQPAAAAPSAAPKRPPLAKGARITGSSLYPSPVAAAKAAAAAAAGDGAAAEPVAKPEAAKPAVTAAPVAAPAAVPAAAAAPVAKPAAAAAAAAPAAAPAAKPAVAAEVAEEVAAPRKGGRGMLLAVAAVVVVGAVGALVVQKKMAGAQGAGVSQAPGEKQPSADKQPDAEAATAAAAAAELAAKNAEAQRAASEARELEEKRLAAEAAEQTRLAAEQKRIEEQKKAQSQTQRLADEKRRQTLRAQADENYKQEKYAAALPLYAEGAGLKDPWSFFRLGKIHTEGFSVAVDKKKGAEYFRQAAEQASVLAQPNLGIWEEWSSRRQTVLGVALAQYNLGVLHELGQGVAKDTQKATELFGAAASLLQKDGAAEETICQWVLGVMFANGQGVKQDEKKALEWMEKAAGSGERNAQVGLAEMYAAGQGVSKDEKKAVEWYQKAVALGDARAEYALAQMSEAGRGTAKDKKKAQELYQQAMFSVLHDVAQGDALAEFNLALMYGEGRGVPKDEKKAAELYQKAAAKNESDAQVNLGAMLVGGAGVAKDLKKAAELFEQAAEQGNDLAKVNLGWLNETGQGVAKDEKKAMAFYAQAAANGVPAAAQALARLSGVAAGSPPKSPVMAQNWRYRVK